MDKTTHYRQLIKSRLSELADLINNQPRLGTTDVHAVCIFDDERSQYLLRTLGRSAGRRVRATTVHIALQDDRIRIEEDNTEHGIATDLLNSGVPKEDIVLAWQSPETRKQTAFATA